MSVAPGPEEIYERAKEEGQRRLSMSMLEQTSTAFIAGVTAELDALVVLAATVAGLLILVLGGFAAEHAASSTAGGRSSGCGPESCSQRSPPPSSHARLYCGGCRVIARSTKAIPLSDRPDRRFAHRSQASRVRVWSEEGVALVEDPGNVSPPPRGPGS